MLKIGQKVICIDYDDPEAAECCDCYDLKIPKVGDIATITGFALDAEGQLCLILKEFPAPKCDHHCAGWTVMEWRPVQERNIKIFKKLLEPA